MREPTESSNEVYRIIYATHMREIWLAETQRKSQLAIRRIEDVRDSLARLRRSAMKRSK